VYNNPVFLKDKRDRAKESPSAGRQTNPNENATVAQRSGGKNLARLSHGQQRQQGAHA